MRARWIRYRSPPAAAGLDGAALSRADGRLLAVLDRDFREAAARAGPHLACAAGCHACCIGPFPITRLDLLRLRRGLAEIERRDPARAGRVRRRAAEARARLTESFPGDASTGRLSASESEVEAFLDRHGAMPCPALDPGTGCCDLYEWRPVTCRTYGPPARFGAESVPPCRLCFVGAAPGEVERCRMEPDREGLEQAILAGIGAAAGEDWETLVAHALVDR
jgi:Fe-S-cluster containining protein